MLTIKYLFLTIIFFRALPIFADNPIVKISDSKNGCSSFIHYGEKIAAELFYDKSNPILRENHDFKLVAYMNLPVPINVRFFFQFF